MTLATTNRIEDKIDRQLAGGIAISANRGLAVESMAQAMEVAKLMSVSGCAVPPHMRNNPGACLAVAIQGWEWGINPFAIANKSYVVNDRIGYEAGLYQAVLMRRAPIRGRPKIDYHGTEGERTCKISACLTDGSVVDYESPKFGRILPKNSPLWKNDPDQQLYYFSVRAFAKRHFQDIMMGVYTIDELQDNSAMVNGEVQPKRGAAAVLEHITQKPVSEGQTFEPTPEAVEQAAKASEAPVAESQPVSEASPAPDATDGANAAESPSEAAKPAGDPLADDAWLDTCEGLAADVDLDPAVWNTARATLLKIKRRSEREKFVASMRAGTFSWKLCTPGAALS